MMTRGKRYRLRSPAIAVAQDDSEGQNVAVTIPEGAIIGLVNDVFLRDRSVVVEWEGKVYVMFAQDFREHGEEVASEGGRLTF